MGNLDFWKRIFAVALGVGIVLVWEVSVGATRVAGLLVCPGIVAYLASALLFPLVLRLSVPTGVGTAWVLFHAITLKSIPSMVIRPASGGIDLSILLAGLLLPFLLLLPFPPVGTTHADESRESKKNIILLGASLVTIFFCQASNWVLRALEVGNENRSLFVGGHEFHHINLGLIGLPIGLCLFAWARRMAGPWYHLSLAWCGVSHGMVMDQWFYYMRINPSDAAYFHISTPLTALIGWGVSLGLLQGFGRGREEKTSQRSSQ